MMNIYSKKHRPPLKVRKVWTLDGRSLEKINGDGGEDLWAFCDPYIEPYNTNHWGAVLPPSPGVFLKAGESAVFTDLDCDQIRFPSGPPMYRGTPGTPVIAPLVVKEAEK